MNVASRGRGNGSNQRSAGKKKTDINAARGSEAPVPLWNLNRGPKSNVTFANSNIPTIHLRWRRVKAALAPGWFAAADPSIEGAAQFAATVATRVQNRKRPKRPEGAVTNQKRMAGIRGQTMTAPGGPRGAGARERALLTKRGSI